METFYTWQNNTWTKSVKSESTYDDKGNIISITTSRQNNWIVDSKFESTYNDKGNITLEIGYRWQNNTWVKDVKSEYTYDDKENRTLVIGYTWQNNTWVEDSKFVDSKSKYEYTYDNKGNKTLEIDYTWHWKNNTWWEYHKYEWEYDVSYSKIDLIFPSDYDMNSMRTEQRVYNWNGINWGSPSVTTYYWSEKAIQEFQR